MIVDFHTHIYPQELRNQREAYIKKDRTFGDLFADPRAKLVTAEDLIVAMDEDNIGHSVVMGIGWTDQGLAREVNDYLIDATNRFPDRLTGFGGISPGWGSETSAREAERCARAGMRGIGELHPTSQDYDLGSESTMMPLIEVVREYGLIVTSHSSEPVGHTYKGKGETTPDMLWRFITLYPDVTLVCAHWGGGLPFYALMPEVAEALDNVYFDTAASPFLYTPHIFDVVAGLVGSKKILLGSDYPLLRTSQLTRQVQESDLLDTDRNAIMGKNAMRLLGI